MNNNNFTNPKAPTLQATFDSSISGSTAVTLNSGTTYMEVSAVAKGIFLAWNRTVSNSDFDEYISSDSTRLYVRPDGATTANFIEETTSATLIVIEK